MAQTSDFVLDPGIGGLAQRVQLNAMIGALLTSNSGPTAPPFSPPGTLWFDTGVTPPVLRFANAANDEWIAIGPETLPTFTVWGNPTGAADAPIAIGMNTLHTMMGFTFDNGSVKRQQVGNGMRFEGGTGTTNGATPTTVTYSAAFTASPIVLVAPWNVANYAVSTIRVPTASGFQVEGWSAPGTLLPIAFSWLAFGK